MPDKKVPDLKEFDLDVLQSTQVNLKDEQEKLIGMHNSLREEVTKFKGDLITKEEFSNRMEKIANDIAGVEQRLQTAEQAATVVGERFQFEDYRHMLTGMEWLTHEDGKPYSEVDYRAHALFHMPIDYDKHDRGVDLRNLRNMHDAVLCVDAFKQFSHGKSGRYRLEDQPLWKAFVEETKKFDEKLGHAMAGGNTGYGAEWVPTEMSAQFNELLRLQPSLANRFQVWQMGKGASGYYPFQNGRATVYKGGESTTDNAEQARKTSIATDRHLFTPTVFIGALIGSEELTEDSIISMVDFIRKELSMALLEGLESAIINGDTAATHIDNVHETKWQTYNVETTFIGLRARADDDSKTFDIETPSSGTGVNALELACLEYQQGLQGVAGARPDQCFWLTGVKGRMQMLHALYDTDALGVLQYIISGQLPSILGSPTHISGQYLETLDSDGFHNASGSQKHTSVTYTHAPSWRIGQRRGITLEMAKDILTQQRQFVATARWDFGTISADAIVPVTCGINVQHTA